MQISYGTKMFGFGTFPRRVHTEKTFRNLFNPNQIWIVITFSDRFDTNRNSIWCHVHRKKLITIQIWFGLIRFKKDF